MRTENVTAGTRIFAQGDHSQEVYRILQGRVEISFNEGGEKGGAGHACGWVKSLAKWA